MKRSNARAGILWGGLLAGTLQLLAMFLLAAMKSHRPDVVLHFIASGLLGVKAFRGGFPTGALGLGLHFFIAFSAADLYWAASRRMRVLVKRPAICGLLYGIPIYLVMNFVVIPLSRIGGDYPHAAVTILPAMLVVMFCVGLPIGAMTRRYTWGL